MLEISLTRAGRIHKRDSRQFPAESRYSLDNLNAKVLTLKIPPSVGAGRIHKRDSCQFPAESRYSLDNLSVKVLTLVIPRS